MKSLPKYVIIPLITITIIALSLIPVATNTAKLNGIPIEFTCEPDAIECIQTTSSHLDFDDCGYTCSFNFQLRELLLTNISEYELSMTMIDDKGNNIDFGIILSHDIKSTSFSFKGSILPKSYQIMFKLTVSGNSGSDKSAIFQLNLEELETILLGNYIVYLFLLLIVLGLVGRVKKNKQV